MKMVLAAEPGRTQTVLSCNREVQFGKGELVRGCACVFENCFFCVRRFLGAFGDLEEGFVS